MYKLDFDKDKRKKLPVVVFITEVKAVVSVVFYTDVYLFGLVTCVRAINLCFKHGTG